MKALALPLVTAKRLLIFQATPQTAVNVTISVPWDKYVNLGHVKQVSDTHIVTENTLIYPMTPKTADSAAWPAQQM